VTIVVKKAALKEMGLQQQYTALDAIVNISPFAVSLSLSLSDLPKVLELQDGVQLVA
jgi:NUMB domain